MKKRQKKDVINYIKYAKEELGLRDWDLDITFSDKNPKRAVARNYPTFGQKKARIVFYNQIKDYNEHDVGTTIIHEILHCHFNPMTNLCANLQFFLNKKTYDMFDLAFTQNMEYCVDAIAEEWYKSLEDFKWT